MGDTEAAKIRAANRSWIDEHRESYLKSGGVDGHILDLSKTGGLSFGTHLLLKYKGRKSGKTLIAPLCYADIGGEVVVVGSKGGSDSHPAWYLNIREMPEVEFQIATQAFRATWREPEGVEREKVWDFMVECYPFYRNYQQSTDRQIPLVMMIAKEPVSVFRLEEADGWRD